MFWNDNVRAVGVLASLAALWALAWLSLFEYQPSADSAVWSAALHLAASLVCLALLVRIHRRWVTWGWCSYCLGQVIQVLEAIAPSGFEAWGPLTALTVGGLLMCAYGFLLAHDRVRFQLDLVRRARDEVDHAAHHDPLTDLPNRILFLDRLKQALARARRDKTCVAVLFLDLDEFKEINDAQGHVEGDRLLAELARRLAACMREADTVSRWGGDEFVFIAGDLEGEQGARDFAARIIGALDARVSLERGSYRMTASVGIALSPHHSEDPDELLRYADAAMFRGKHTPGNAVMVHSVHHQSSVRSQPA